MSFKNPRNLIAVVSVIAALLAGTVLLGGYANSNAAENDAPVKACQGKMAGCPMTAQTASCPKMMGAQAEMTGCSGTPAARSAARNRVPLTALSHVVQKMARRAAAARPERPGVVP